ncbi:MAG: helix-turn-helix domain-containing protein [Lachnospiraceae bacterium]|nr:helix-turn-helix domain-containing protein [Lachnospiraceae bacterium]
MDTAKVIKELRESIGMSRKEFSQHTGVPVRTIEDWEAARRTPPNYIPRLLGYQLKYEEVNKINHKLHEKICIISDPDGRKLVLINDIKFKSRKSVDWNKVEQFLKKYIDEYYEILESAEKVYIGTDFPDEYAHSNDTRKAQGANKKAKANAISAIGELIEIASDRNESPDYNKKHGGKAKFGWYRYDTRFGIPVYDEEGVLDRYNIFRARLIVRRDKDRKLYLYDIVRIKKETSKPLESLTVR